MSYGGTTKLECEAFSMIFEELAAAKKAHPEFPQDPIHAVAIMAEEAGEAVRAANDMIHHGKPASAIQKELIQTAAMCFRCLFECQDISIDL